MIESFKYVDETYIRKNFDSASFPSEKALCDYLELNLNTFSEDVLGKRMKSYVREMKLVPIETIPPVPRPRIDFMVELEDGKRIGIECKNPKSSSFGSLTQAVSQLLGYYVLAQQLGTPFDKLYILTTKFNPVTALVIKQFNLPIELLVFKKGEIAQAMFDTAN